MRFRDYLAPVFTFLGGLLLGWWLESVALSGWVKWPVIVLAAGFIVSGLWLQWQKIQEERRPPSAADIAASLSHVEEALIRNWKELEGIDVDPASPDWGQRVHIQARDGRGFGNSPTYAGVALSDARRACDSLQERGVIRPSGTAEEGSILLYDWTDLGRELAGIVSASDSNA